MRAWLRDSTHKTYVSACERKARYKSEAVARAYGQRSIQRGQAAGGRLWVYACPACRGWHLTHRQEKTPAITHTQMREGFK